MKRSLVLVPIILLVILNACGDPNSLPPNFNGAQWTEVAARQTALGWTPTISPTPNPNESEIVRWMNVQPANPDGNEVLEETIGPIYMVFGVTFPASFGIQDVFEVDVNCVCTRNTKCCSPDRMFVITMMKMQPFRDQIMAEVPSSVSWFKLMAFDHYVQIAEVDAPWSSVRGFLSNDITGYELGSQVNIIPVP
jgi:hypothetical protein